MKFVRFVVAAGLLLGGGYAIAQEKPPVLSLEQKQAVQIAAQQVEISQLRLAQLIQSLQKEGYDLDLQTMTYVEKKKAAKTGG